YKGFGWISMGDWLGTNAVASTKKKFLPYEEAREVVRARRFKDKTEYEAWARSNERPSEIPALHARTPDPVGRVGATFWGCIIDGARRRSWHLSRASCRYSIGLSRVRFTRSFAKIVA